MKTKPFLLIFFILSIHIAKAQNWSWIKRGPGTNVSRIKGNAITLDRFLNHIIITGIDSSNYGPGGSPVSFYVAKYDNLGNLLWQRECKGTKFAYDIETDSQGNIYFLSERFTLIDNQPVSINGSFCIVKLDPNGRLVWASPISSVNRGTLFELSAHKPIIEIDNNNDLFFAASIYTESFRFLDSLYSYPAVSSGDVFVAKFDTAGKVKWSRRFIVGSGVNGRTGGVFDIDVNNNGRIAIAGFFEINIVVNGQTITGVVSSGSNPSARTPFLTVLNTTTGNSYFAKRYTSNYANNYITGVILKDNNTTVSCARVRGGFIMIASGTTLWGGTDIFFTDSIGTDNPAFKSISGEINYHYMDFDNDASGNIYASCFVSPANGGNPNDSFNIRFQKYDPAGTFLYQSSINVLNKFYYSYGHFKVRDSVMAVTGHVVPRLGNIQIGNNVITGGADSIFSYVGSIQEDKNNLITGRLFYDRNNNGLQDPQESGIPNRMISALPGFNITSTLANGDYHLYTDSASYTVTVPNIPRYHVCIPASYSVPLLGYGLRADNKNFALQPIPNVKDLRIDVSPFHIPRPGFPINYYIIYSNIGTTTLSGNYSFKFTSNLQFLSSDSTTTFLNSDSASWSYTNLNPGEARHNIIRCVVKPTTPIGTLLNQFAYIYPIVNDTIPADNIDSLRQTVRGSYDPNDKLVDPTSEIIIDSAQAGKQFLEYTIRFQNTGTDTAFQIRVLDTLSSKLNLNTFEVVSSSHPFQLITKSPNVLEFYFRNVLLPDSNTNEPKSHGFVKFRIKPLTSVILNDTIRNRAGIYFDYNLPVGTNTTVTTFRNYIITGIGNVQNNSKNLMIYPNPVKDELIYKIKNWEPGELTLRLYDIKGRLLFSTSMHNYSTSIDGSIPADFLIPGSYILEVTGKKMQANKKFIKQ